jgi:hypothetical protein
MPNTTAARCTPQARCGHCRREDCGTCHNTLQTLSSLGVLKKPFYYCCMSEEELTGGACASGRDKEDKEGLCSFDSSSDII